MMNSSGKNLANFYHFKSIWDELAMPIQWKPEINPSKTNSRQRRQLLHYKYPIGYMSVFCSPFIRIPYSIVCIFLADNLTLDAPKYSHITFVIYGC